MTNFLKILKSIIMEAKVDRSKDDRYSGCLTSDIIRMEIIEQFFEDTQDDPTHNIDSPNYSDLVDTWDGYQDQVYVQNNLRNNEFIYFEGWVPACWDALYMKKEYENLDKQSAIEKVINDRFGRIGDEFGYKIKNYDYYTYGGHYIMEVIFTKNI